MKSVVVVGAGPAGLVAAKTLLHAFPPHTFSVTVLDRNDRVGGMWAVEPGQRDGKLDPEMRTNLSRFTVAFSDFLWDPANLGKDAEGKGVDLPMFPKAWQVGRYLQAYAARYIPSGVVKLQSRVMKAERVKRAGREMWMVEWNGPPQPGNPPLDTPPSSPEDIGYLLATCGSTYQGFFDYLVVASGFLSIPRKLDIDVSGQGSAEALTNIQHSSEFRDINGLVKTGHAPRSSIVVIGGGMSGAEAAATAALQISDAQHSPSKASLVGDYQVYHVSPRPFYPIPRYLPSQPPDSKRSAKAPTFGPLDLRFYDLTRRPAGPVVPMNGRVPPEKAARIHQYLQSFLGDDLVGIESPALIHEDETLARPAYISITDSYTEFVRSGKIIPICGRVKKLHPRQRSGTQKPAVESVRVRPLTPATDHPQEDILIKNIAGLIHATGYSQSATHWLPADVRETMQHNASCHRLPLLLNNHCTAHHAIPNLGFVGFYEGPYWGIMEMQARLLGRTWSTNTSDSSQPSPPPPHQTAEIAELAELRTAILAQDPAVPPFWMGDYVGLLEALARELDIPRVDIPEPPRGRAGLSGSSLGSGPAVPARYAERDNADTQPTLLVLQKTLDFIDNGPGFVAQAVFRALQGEWVVDRVVEGNRKKSAQKKWVLDGEGVEKVRFEPRMPTSGGFEAEYLAVHDGMEENARAWRLGADGRISVWSVKSEEDKEREVKGLLHELRFETPGEGEDEGWKAYGKPYACGDDVCETEYEFRFNGVRLEQWGVRSEVKSPNKEYVVQSWFER